MRLTAVACLVCALTLGLLAGMAAAAKLTPEGQHTPVAVGISGTVYRYFELTQDAPVRVVVEGPSAFEAITRWRFSSVDAASVDVVVEATVDDGDAVRHVLHMRSGGASYADIEDASPGRPERIHIEIPSGLHEIELRLVSPAGTVDVNPLSQALEVMPWRFDWTGSMRFTYDSNIYRYSDDDVVEFADGERYERYPLDTTDELRLDPAVTFRFTREAPGARGTEFLLGARWYLAGSNGDKSFSKFRVRYTETLTGMLGASLEYAAIPAYHIKYVWDADTPSDGDRYRSCDFRKHALKAALSTDGQFPIDLATWWEYDDYGYDQDFVEYDTWSNTFGARVTVRPVHGLRLDGQYEYRRSLSRGYDELGEDKRTSDDSDTTYDQNEYELRARLEAGRVRGLPVVLKVRLGMQRRYYLTENTADRYHAGRDDTMWVAGARVELGLTDLTSLVCAYEHRARRSESDVIPTIGDAKDYDADRFSVQFVVEGGRFLD